MSTKLHTKRRGGTDGSRTSTPRSRLGPCSLALASAVVISAVLGVFSPAHSAGIGLALYSRLARDAVPAKLRRDAQARELDIPAEERSMGLVGSILVSVPDQKAHIRYFVFDTRENAARGYRCYVQQPWGGPMRRLAQDEFTPKQNIAPGLVTCELQRNESTRLFVSACLHVHASLPVLTRSTQPVKFNDSVRFGDAEVQRMRYMAAAADGIELVSEGTLHVERIAPR